MLELKNVEVKYLNTILVLKGVNIQLETGGFACILGANGAGKTTTLKAISGLLRTEEGEVTDGGVYYEGKPIHKFYPEDIARMGILQVMEGRRLAEHLTVEENLRVGAYARKDREAILKDLESVYRYFPRLKDLRGHVSGYLSGGERQMLVVGRALMSSPKVMLLDEPSLGLSPLLVKEIFGIIKKINREKKTSILLVEQNANIALSTSDYGYIMENGRVVLDGPSPKLKENEDIKEFYLGLSQVGKRKSFREVKHYRRRKRWLS